MTRIAPSAAQLEREIDVQADVVRLCESVGCTVVRFSEGRRARVTPGVADLRVYCPRARIAFWFETKAPGGTQRPAQRTFQAMVETCGETYVLGGLDAALVQLRRLGLIG